MHTREASLGAAVKVLLISLIARSQGSTAATGQCSDTCAGASNGECQDGGPGTILWDCDFGTDCTDCGPRNADTTYIRPPQVPRSGCNDTCASAGDGECQDGGPGTILWDCDFGTDCTDCGVRALEISPPTPPPSPHWPEAAPDGTSAMVIFLVCACTCVFIGTIVGLMRACESCTELKGSYTQRASPIFNSELQMNPAGTA